jgi:hypothetical protein
MAEKQYFSAAARFSIEQLQFNYFFGDRKRGIFFSAFVFNYFVVLLSSLSYLHFALFFEYTAGFPRSYRRAVCRNGSQVRSPSVSFIREPWTQAYSGMDPLWNVNQVEYLPLTLR